MLVPNRISKTVEIMVSLRDITSGDFRKENAFILQLGCRLHHWALMGIPTDVLTGFMTKELWMEPRLLMVPSTLMQNSL